MTRYFRWIGVLPLLVICAVGPRLCADELVAPGVDTVTSFTGATVADYDLKVTLATQTIVVTGSGSGPGEAQVIPSLGAVSGPGDMKIGFVSHKGGSASYLVWGSLGGGAGSGPPPQWINQYTTGSASTAYFIVYVGDRNSIDDDVFTYDYSSKITVELLNAQPGQTYTVVVSQTPVENEGEAGGQITSLPAVEQVIVPGTPLVIQGVFAAQPGHLILAAQPGTSSAPAAGATSQADAGMGGYVKADIVQHLSSGPPDDYDLQKDLKFTYERGTDSNTKKNFNWDEVTINGTAKQAEITLKLKYTEDGQEKTTEKKVKVSASTGVPVVADRIVTKVKVVGGHVISKSKNSHTDWVETTTDFELKEPVEVTVAGGDATATTEVGKQKYPKKSFEQTQKEKGHIIVIVLGVDWEAQVTLKLDVEVEVTAYKK